MKKLKYLIILFLLTTHSNIFASDAGILSGVSATALRNGDIHVDDIPRIILTAIDFLMGIAGTVAVVFIIIGAYRILLGSLDNNKTKGKQTITLAITGFVLASVSWIIMKLIIDNFT